MDDSSDTDTVRGWGASGTDTESVVSSRSTDRNRRKKEKKKASKARQQQQAATTANGNGAVAGASSFTSETASDLVVEYVSQRDDLADNPEFAELAAVFGHFTTAEELMGGKKASGARGDGENGEDGEDGEGAGGKKAKKASLAAGEDGEGGDGGADGPNLSSKAKKRAKRLSLAELKQLVQKPEVVEAWDVTSDDPRLLVHLKSYRNSIPVPKHWSQKRKFLMGKRGSEKAPFQLPEFIAATGIEKIRAAVLEKENAKRLKGKMKEKMQPKMGKIDIDYQVS